MEGRQLQGLRLITFSRKVEWKVGTHLPDLRGWTNIG